MAPPTPTNEHDHTAPPTVQDIEGVVPDHSSFRTVHNFDDEEDLRMALMNMDITTRDDCRNEERDREEGEEGDDEDRADDDVMEDPNWDWTCPEYDVAKSTAPSITQEAKRLMNLKTFGFMLGRRDTSSDNTNANQQVLDRFSAMGQRLLKTPICTINFLDLGRAYLVSGQGVGSITESPRKPSWCNHTIRYLESADQCMVVEDATKDWRFHTTDYVTGPLHLRYYAGTPLVSPEGYRLGTVCIMGFEPRTFTQDDRTTLLDISSLAMAHMVERRHYHLLQQSMLQQQSCQSLVVECLGPLKAAKNSLDILHQSKVQLDNVVACQQQQRALVTAVVATNFAHDVWVQETQHNHQNMPSSPMHVDVWFRQLHTLLDPIPKRVPAVLRLSSDLPRVLSVLAPLPLLRASLAVLSQACASTTRGRINFQLRLDSSTKNNFLVVECQAFREEQPETPPSESIQQIVQTLHGTCGYDSQQQRTWFSVPLVDPRPIIHHRSTEPPATSTTTAKRSRDTGSDLEPAAADSASQMEADQYEEPSAKRLKLWVTETCHDELVSLPNVDDEKE